MCEQVAPGKFQVNGVDHLHWFCDICQLFASGAGVQGNATPVHAWTEFTGFAKAFGYQGVGSIHLTEYCIELARAYHQDPGLLIWTLAPGIRGILKLDAHGTDHVVGPAELLAINTDESPAAPASTSAPASGPTSTSAPASGPASTPTK